MNSPLFPRTWRGKDTRDSSLPVGQANVKALLDKLQNAVQEFITRIFNYEEITVAIIEIQQDYPYTPRLQTHLVDIAGHTRYIISVLMFNNIHYEFSVSNIPTTPESSHVVVFFDALTEYIKMFNDAILKTTPTQNGHVIASTKFTYAIEILLYNIERTIIIEYIYHLFNTYNSEHTITEGATASPLRYDIDLINQILDFSIELNTKKVENKEIYCGFVFHDNNEGINENSAQRIKFKKSIKYGDFGSLKNYLEISNGRNTFFNVTDDVITHMFITKDPVNEISLTPIKESKTFFNRPLIVSIQGNGKIYFIEGGLDTNKVVLQINNSRPIIRDNQFIKNRIQKSLRDFSTATPDQVDFFSKWIMSLSLKKHGTSLIFCELNASTINSFIKATEISIENQYLANEQDYTTDLVLLDSIINPDGAVIFDKNLIPNFISTILPIGNSTGSSQGGSRHNSVKNYTKSYQCLGIVISEDGPITIFKNGEQLIKF